MDDYKEDERHVSAAIIIQKSWREFKNRNNEVDPALEGGHDNGGALFDKERSEEELCEALLEQCRTLLTEREALRETNLAHQRTCCKIFADKRGSTAVVEHQITPDADAKYWDTIRRVHTDRLDIAQLKESLGITVDDIRVKHDILVGEASLQEAAFRKFLKDKISQATNILLPGATMPVASPDEKKKPKRRLPKGTWETFEHDDDESQKELRDSRVHYIRLRNKLKRQQKDIEGRERGRGNSKDIGMHLIDYEQLKIENTNLNEKIEERNEELLKLRKKATTTIHILTHVKEKLEFVRNENVTLQRRVASMEETLTTLRDRLNQSKRERDHFANENIHMREKMPMIGSEDLLLDYEVRKKEIEKCRINIVDLTNKHHQLVQWINTHQPLLETMKASVK